MTFLSRRPNRARIRRRLPIRSLSCRRGQPALPRPLRPPPPAMPGVRRLPANRRLLSPSRSRSPRGFQPPRPRICRNSISNIQRCLQGSDSTFPAGGAETKTAGQQTGVRLQGDVLFDTKGFNLDEYARMVKDRCEEHWLIPSNLRTFQGSVTIVFYITKEGQVTGAKIEVSSGNDSLDISALTAVWESSPFPPLPRGFPAERVGARLVFAYNER